MTPEQPEHPELVEGRVCGACNVCCVALTIDDPALQKPQGYRCRNATRENGCAIYDTRPQTCRSFFCGWRKLKWIRPGLRPDVSGVLVRLHGEISASGQARQGIMVTLLTNAALKAEGLAESVAAAVSAGLPVYLHVPGPPGYTASRAKMNDILGDAVHARDKAAILAILRRARAQGRSGAHEPIVLARYPDPEAPAQES